MYWLGLFVQQLKQLLSAKESSGTARFARLMGKKDKSNVKFWNFKFKLKSLHTFNTPIAYFYSDSRDSYVNYTASNIFCHFHHNYHPPEFILVFSKFVPKPFQQKKKLIKPFSSRRINACYITQKYKKKGLSRQLSISKHPLEGNIKRKVY